MSYLVLFEKLFLIDNNLANSSGSLTESSRWLVSSASIAVAAFFALPNAHTFSFYRFTITAGTPVRILHFRDDSCPLLSYRKTSACSKSETIGFLFSWHHPISMIFCKFSFPFFIAISVAFLISSNVKPSGPLF